MKALVTGAAGFIGSHVAQECLDLGMSVVGLDDYSGGFSDNPPKGVDMCRGDVGDETLVGKLWRNHKFDFVYHLAAYAAEGLSHHIRRYNYTNNVVDSANLINASIRHGVKRFVFTSSIAVYGSAQTPMDEDVTPLPEDPYGIAKYAVELDLAAAHRYFGLPFTIFRPHNVYGERQNHGDRYRNVVGIFINQCLKGEPMTVFGNGMQTRAFSYISDVAKRIALAPLVDESAGKTLNIGADESTTVIGLAREVAAVMGVEFKVCHLPNRKEVVHAFADHSSIRRVFGDYAPVPLRTGLEAMVSWARSKGPREQTRFQNIEVPERLPLLWQ